MAPAQGQSLNTFFSFSLESEFLTLPISASLVCLSGTESFGLFSCLVNGEEREQTHRAVFRYINSLAHGDPQPQPTDCLGHCCLWRARGLPGLSQSLPDLRFIPRHPDELELDVDDPVLVEAEEDDFWFRGFNMRTGERGVFPAFYAHAVPGPAKDLLGKTPTYERKLATTGFSPVSPPSSPQGASGALAGWSALMCSSWAPWKCRVTRATASCVQPCRRSVWRWWLAPAGGPPGCPPVHHSTAPVTQWPPALKGGMLQD